MKNHLPNIVVGLLCAIIIVMFYIGIKKSEANMNMCIKCEKHFHRYHSPELMYHKEHDHVHAECPHCGFTYIHGTDPMQPEPED